MLPSSSSYSFMSLLSWKRIMDYPPCCWCCLALYLHCLCTLSEFQWGPVYSSGKEPLNVYFLSEVKSCYLKDWGFLVIWNPFSRIVTEWCSFLLFKTVWFSQVHFAIKCFGPSLVFYRSVVISPPLFTFPSQWICFSPPPAFPVSHLTSTSHLLLVFYYAHSPCSSL